MAASLLPIALSIFILLAVSAYEIRVPGKVPGQLWTPGINRRFANLSLDERKRFLGSVPMDSSKIANKFKPATRRIDLPQNFNAADAWPMCADSMKTVRDQGGCQSCWASAAAAAMSDLTCIKCNGQFSPFLSDQDLLTCCWNCGDCEHGGRVDYAFDFWIREGLVTGGPYNSSEGCQPYSISRNTTKTPTCSTTCGPWYNNAYDKDKHKGDTYAIVHGPEEMQHAIYTYGPIVTVDFNVYEDFQTNYKGGIYHHTSGKYVGLHAVKVVGWGVDDGVPYWLVANSWGTDWGLDGFFKIKRGDNECNFESVAFQGSAYSAACFAEPGTSTTPIITKVTTTTENTQSTTMAATTTGHQTTPPSRAVQNLAVTDLFVVTLLLCFRSLAV